MKNSAKNPEDLTTISGGSDWSDQRSDDSLSSNGFCRLCAMTRLKDERYDTSDRRSCRLFLRNTKHIVN